MKNTEKYLKKICSSGILYAVILLVFIVPVFRLLIMSLKTAEGYSFKNYTLLLQETRTQRAIINTMIIAIGSTAIATVLGCLSAFVIAYTNIRGKRFIELLILLPFIIPSYIITLSWSGLLSQKGMINQTLQTLGVKTINIYTIGGIILVLGFCNIPIVYMNVIHMLRKVPVDLEWASRFCGYNIWQTMIKINLVQVMPAIAGGAVLAFLSAIDNFSVPAFLGISSGIPVLSTYIYEKSISFGPNSFPLAAALSVILSVIAVGGTFVESIFVKKSSSSESVNEDYSERIILNKGNRRLLQSVMTILFCIINIVPLMAMFKSAFQKNYGVKWTMEQFTLNNFATVFHNNGVMTSIKTSIILALCCCALCILIGTAIAYQKVRCPGKVITIAEKSAAMVYAIPGIVIALAMIFHWVEPLPGIRPGIYGTINILLVAYVTRYLILQIKGSTTAILSVDPALEEANAASGHGKFTLWKKIIIPMIAGPVLSSSFIIFVSALTELTLSSMLAAAGTRTIGLMIFNFQQAGDYNMAAAMSAVIVVMILAGFILVNGRNSNSMTGGEKTNESYNRKYQETVRSDLSTV